MLMLVMDDDDDDDDDDNDDDCVGEVAVSVEMLIIISNRRR